MVHYLVLEDMAPKVVELFLFHTEPLKQRVELQSDNSIGGRGGPFFSNGTGGKGSVAAGPMHKQKRNKRKEGWVEERT